MLRRKCDPVKSMPAQAVAVTRSSLLELSRPKNDFGFEFHVDGFAEAFASSMHSQTLLTTNPIVFGIIFTRDPYYNFITNSHQMALICMTTFFYSSQALTTPININRLLGAFVSRRGKQCMTIVNHLYTIDTSQTFFSFYRERCSIGYYEMICLFE